MTAVVRKHQTDGFGGDGKTYAIISNKWQAQVRSLCVAPPPTFFFWGGKGAWRKGGFGAAHVLGVLLANTNRRRGGLQAEEPT